MFAPLVAVITPAHHSKRFTAPDCFYNLSQTQNKNTKFIIVDNNNSAEQSQYLRLMAEDIIGIDRLIYVQVKEPIIDKNTNPKIKGVSSIGAQVFNIGLDYAIKIGASYSVIVGTDVMIAPRSIPLLIKGYKKFKDAGVVCLHCNYRNENPEFANIKGLVPAIPMVVPLREDQGGTGEISSTEYFSQSWYKARAGNGCMLTPRKVFSQIRWREDLEGCFFGADYQYCEDVREKLGLFTYIRTDVKSLHVSGDGQCFW